MSTDAAPSHGVAQAVQVGATGGRDGTLRRVAASVYTRSALTSRVDALWAPETADMVASRRCDGRRAGRVGWAPSEGDGALDNEAWAIAGLTIFSLVLGAALTILIELARGQLERKQRRQDRRDDFQRQTLVELQEALFRHKQSLDVSIQEFRELRAGQLPASFFWPENVPAEGRAAGARVTVLSVRATDETLRKIVKNYRQTVIDRLTKAEDAEEAEAILKELDAIFAKANDRIGQLLRPL